MKNIKQTTKFLVIAVLLLAGFVTPSKSFAQLYTPLQVFCRPNTSSAQVNTSVGWSASGIGGNGIYTYAWSGTDSISGTTNSVSQTYTTEGVKNASISVSSNGQTVTANCGSIYVYPVNYYNYNFYDNYSGTLSGSCSSNMSNPSINTSVNWSAYAVGGNGTYTYSWTDFQGYVSSGQYVSRAYTTAGQKSMTLTITSGSQSITRYCNVYVSAITPVINTPTYTYTAPTYQIPSYQIQNQVLGYSSTNPTLASVYLSDVPYTGLKDILKPLLFVFGLLSWGVYLAHKFTKESVQA